MALPTSQRAVIITNPGPDAEIAVKDVPVPRPSRDEVLVRLSYTGVCRGDVSLLYGDFDKFAFGLDGSQTPGHEGVGYVVEVGAEVDSFKIGDRVGIKWLRSVCRKCSYCVAGNDQWCRNQTHFGRNYSGSFQQFVTSPADYTTRIPPGIPDEEVGPLLCAGVTMYRALSLCPAVKGSWVVIMGAGGGLGSLGIQIGKVMGKKIIGVDSGAKKSFCIFLGVDHFIDFTEEADIAKKVVELTDDGAAAVVVAVGDRKSYEQAAKMLDFGGTLVCVGLPSEAFYIPIQTKEFLDKSCVVTGVSASSLEQIQEALQFAAQHHIRPNIQIFELEEAEIVFRMLRDQKISGRAVLDLR